MTNKKITIEQFKEDANILTSKELAKKYSVSEAAIWKKAKIAGVKLLTTAKKGRPSKFDF